MGIRDVELYTQDKHYAGVGGYPNSEGIMELGSAMMDHMRRYGAMMALQNITTPISVARSVLEKCVHNVLVGEGALKWALENGFVEDKEGVLTESLYTEWAAWMKEKERKLQKLSLNSGVSRSSVSSSGDSSANASSSSNTNSNNPDSHDTVGVICLDKQSHAGTSTSGWKFKRPGRVGDSPIVGSRLYCHGLYGAAVASDGEEIVRICLSYLVVEMIRQG